MFWASFLWSHTLFCLILKVLWNDNPAIKQWNLSLSNFLCKYICHRCFFIWFGRAQQLVLIKFVLRAQKCLLVASSFSVFCKFQPLVFKISDQIKVKWIVKVARGNLGIGGSNGSGLRPIFSWVLEAVRVCFNFAFLYHVKANQRSLNYNERFEDIHPDVCLKVRENIS